MSRKTRIVRERATSLEDFCESLINVGQERQSMLWVVYEKGRYGFRPEHIIKKIKRFGYQPLSCGHHHIHNGQRKK